MFYNKKYKTPKTENLTLEIKDFSKGLNFSCEENILKPYFSVNAYNYSFKKGVLTEGYGIKTLSVPNYNDDSFNEVFVNPDTPDVSFNKVWFYKIYDEEIGGRVDKLMYYADDQSLMFQRVLTPYPIIAKCFTITLPERPVFTYNYKLNDYDYNLICAESYTKLYDGFVEPEDLPNAPKISSMCEDKGKMFCSTYGDRNCVYYHIGTNIRDWTTTEDLTNGKILMNDNRGKINKVIPFLGYVFVIRDFGISKISHYENKNTIDVSHLSLYGNKIYENTVAICGDKMLMLTKDGIASFNGVTSKILDLGLNEFLKFNNDNAIGVFHSGKYYLACKLAFNDEEKIGCETLESFNNNALIVLDVNTLNYDIIRGIDILSMESVQFNKMDKVVMVLNNKKDIIVELNNNGAFYDEPFKKEWNSPLTDLGYSNKIKLVKNVSLLSNYDCNLTIFTEKQSKTFKIKGSNTLNKIKVNLKGKQIGVKITSETKNSYISNLKFDIDLLDYEFTKF